MKFGVCLDISNEQDIRTVAAAGYDYFEGNYQFFANGDSDKKSFAKRLVAESGLPVLAANCFLPGDLKTSGPERNDKALREYILRGLDYALPLGLKTVVFGSGGARNVPESLSFTESFLQTADFLRTVALPIMRENGVTLCIEPLCRDCSDIFHTVKEGAMLAALAGDDCRVLADLYHMHVSGDDMRNIRDVGQLLRHAHISNPTPPGMPGRRIFMHDVNEFDYKTFVDALRAVGCETCSVEASVLDIEKDAPAALSVLKEL